jgi:hypothetical protein
LRLLLQLPIACPNPAAHRTALSGSVPDSYCGSNSVADHATVGRADSRAKYRADAGTVAASHAASHANADGDSDFVAHRSPNGYSKPTTDE